MLLLSELQASDSPACRRMCGGCFGCGLCRLKVRWTGSMRIRSQSDTMDSLEEDTVGRSAGGRLIRGFQKLWRTPNQQVGSGGGGGVPDGPYAAIVEQPQITTTPSVLQTFQQCLEDQLFFEAGQLLVQRENRLFGLEGRVEGGVEDEAQLRADRTALEKQVLQTLQQSLSESVSPSALSSAVRAVQLDEQQDQLWRQRGGTAPGWRPCGWRRLHDIELQALVEKRMDDRPALPPGPEQSSIKTDINGMGRRLKEDLLLVATALKSCYPPDMDICNLYAAQYHRIFSAKLSELAQFGMDDSDCTFLLRWANEYYPGILQKPELQAEINASSLGKLLSEELLEPLEKQFLSKQESELTGCMSRVLQEAREKYSSGREPDREDGCYFSPVAFDVTQFVNGIVTSAEVVVGDLHKAQKITCHLKGLMQRFQSFQAEVIRQNRDNSRAQVKANLCCIAQFRDVLLRKTRLFPQNVQENCLSLLNDMKQSAHLYLLAPAHKALHPHYKKVGTSSWLLGCQFQKLLDVLEKELEQLQGSTPSCHQELMGQLHQEVTEEYVKRLLKGQIKLNDKTKQHNASARVKDDAESLHKVFSKMGSQEEWLKEILDKIAELLKLQDVPALQMHVVSLGTDYPDLSERHVSALLKLKTNICKSDRGRIKATLVDTLEGCSAESQSRSFFSRVKVK